MKNLKEKIDENMKELNSKIIRDENIKKPMSIDDISEFQDLTTENMSQVYDSEWGDNIIDEIADKDTKRLSPQELKKRLTALLDLEVEKRLDDALGSIPEDIEVDMAIKKQESPTTK